MAANRKKHIAMYIGSLDHGGSERVMSGLLSYFYKEGYQVTLVTTYIYPDEYEVENAAWHITSAPGPLGENGAVNAYEDQGEGIRRIVSGLTKKEEGNRLINVYRRYAKLRGIWKKIKPDLILSFLGKNNIMALSTAKGLGIPVVVSVRSNPAREYKDEKLNRLMRKLFPSAAGVVLQNEEAAQYFPDNIKSKVRILKNPLDPAFFGEPYKGEREHVIVNVARLDANKNQGMLIRAFSSLHKSHPDYRLVFYGNGERKTEYEALVRELGLEESVCFAGVVNDVADRIRKAGIYVLCSDNEGIPNSVIEAMCLGIPCIVTDTPSKGPAQLIQNNENGFLIPVGDEKALEEKLRILMDDKDEAKRLGNAALKLRKSYDPAVTAGEWKNYFEELMRP